MKRGTLQYVVCVLAVGAWLAGCSSSVVEESGKEVGSYSYVRNALESQHSKDIATVYQAAVKAFEELQIPAAESKQDALTAKVEGKDASGDKITVELESQTKDQTTMKIKVGRILKKDKAIRVFEAINSKL